MAKEQNHLRAILEFDPETWNRVDVEHNGISPPPEIQSAFVQWVNDQDHPENSQIKVYPERLFIAVKTPQSVRRIYHLWNPSLEPLEQTFPRAALAEFIERYDDYPKYEPFGIHLFDEVPDEKEQHNKISIRFNNLGHNIIILGVHIWFRSSGRMLYVENLEFVDEVRFTEHDGKQDIFEVTLSKEMGWDKFPNGTIEETIEGFEEQMVVCHILNGQVIDRVKISRDKWIEDIIDELFDEGLLNDPFSAPLIMDYSWRFIDVGHLTGVTWYQTKVSSIPVNSDRKVESDINEAIGKRQALRNLPIRILNLIRRPKL